MSTPEQALGRGWQANLSLGFSYAHGKTVLSERQHQGPLTVQRPFYPEGDICHVYVLHPPGGVVAGDCLTVKVHANAHSKALITTPAAAKFYRSEGLWAYQTSILTIAATASVEWLPQETIIYEGAQVKADTTVYLAKDAHFIGWEIVVFGRPAAQEGFAAGQVIMLWQFFHEQQLCYRDRLVIDAQTLLANWGLQGRCVCGTLFAYPASKASLGVVQALIEDHPHCGVSVVGELLICRALAYHADQLREFFQQIWQALRPEFIQRTGCPPRIWST